MSSLFEKYWYRVDARTPLAEVISAIVTRSIPLSSKSLQPLRGCVAAGVHDERGKCLRPSRHPLGAIWILLLKYEQPFRIRNILTEYLSGCFAGLSSDCLRIICCPRIAKFARSTVRRGTAVFTERKFERFTDRGSARAYTPGGSR